jgi:hypothetical protein
MRKLGNGFEDANENMPSRSENRSHQFVVARDSSLAEAEQCLPRFA